MLWEIFIVGMVVVVGVIVFARTSAAESEGREACRYLRKSSAVENADWIRKQRLQFLQQMGVPHQEAWELTQKMIKDTWGLLTRTGIYSLPVGFIHDVLGTGTDFPHPKLSQLAESLRRDLPQLEAEGVHRGDVVGWWSTSLFERQFMFVEDGMTALTIISDGYDASTATDPDERALDGWELLKRSVPIYQGSRVKPKELVGPDRLLPDELKMRVVDHMNELMFSRPWEMESIKTEYSSCNAWVREQIARGLL